MRRSHTEAYHNEVSFEICGGLVTHCLTQLLWCPLHMGERKVSFTKEIDHINLIPEVS